MRDQAQDSDRQQADELAPHKEPETNETAPRTGDVDAIKAEDRSHFFAVANSLLGALHWQSPQLVLPDRLTRREADAITLIYEARTAQQSEYGGGHISALERMRYLNEGLIALQSVLAMARSPAFPQARSHIEEIRRLIAKLKEEIAQAIIAEERKKVQEQAKKDEEKKKGDDAAKAKQAAEAQAKKS
jgi:hypothetical protein